MKKEPKNKQKVWWIAFDANAETSPRGITVQSVIYGLITPTYEYDLFESYVKAQKARNKIIKILQGE